MSSEMLCHAVKTGGNRRPSARNTSSNTSAAPIEYVMAHTLVQNVQCRHDTVPSVLCKTFIRLNINNLFVL